MPNNALSAPRKSLLLLSMVSCLLPLSPLSAREEDPVRYVVTLETARRPIAPRSISLSEPLLTYVTSFKRSGATWYRLRLGFFASRAEANQVFERIRAQFPAGWVTRVSKKEKLQVISGRIDSTPVTGLASSH